MAYIEISELTETLQVDNDSVFPVVYQGATRKIKFSSFKQMLNYFTAVSYNKTTGVFTFTKVDGTSATLTSDLQLSFKDVSFDSSTGMITFTKQSGETKTLDCNGKRFITANEITKLSGIEAGAQVNVIETVKVNGEALTPDANKAVDIDLSNRDEEISDLKTKNELLVKDHVPIENTGAELQLTGTGDLPMSIIPYGNISQETTSIAGGDEYDSPSVEHESPAKVVDGEYEIVAENKNLLDINKATSNYPNSININKTNNSLLYTFTQRLSWAHGLITISNLKVGDTITLSGTGLSSASEGFSISIRNGSNQVLTEILSLQGVSNFIKTIALSSNVFDGILNIWFIPRAGQEYTEAGTTLLLKNLQLNLGSSATTYVSHAEQLVEINTSPNPLYSENDHYEYLTSEEATFLGLNTGEGWYVYNKWIKEKLSSTNQTWQKFGTSISGKYRYATSDYSDIIKKPSLTTDIANIKCNYYKAQMASTGGSWGGNTGISVHTDGMIFINDDNYQNDLDGWLSFVDSVNMYIVFELETPIYTKITNTNLINSLNTLQDMQSYYNITNISQTHGNNQADMRINAKALKSLKAMQSEIDNLISRVTLLED